MTVVRRALAYELGIWVSLFRWIFRKPRKTDKGAHRYGYSATTMPVMFAFIGVSIVEIPILHFILPWQTVRIVAFALSIWGLLWMIGLLASLRVYPHLVGDDGLRVRNGFRVDVAIPWEAVAEVRTRNRPLEKSKAIQFEETDDGRLIGKIVVLGQTNVDVIFKEPTAVALSRGPVDEVRFWADDPAALVEEARTGLDADATTRPRHDAKDRPRTDAENRPAANAGDRPNRPGEPRPSYRA